MVQKFTKWFILEPLIYEDRLHLREISRRVGVPHPTLNRYLYKLIREGIVRKEKVGNQTYYRLNKQHPLLIDVVSIVEKERVLFLAKDNLLLREIIYHLHNLNAEVIIIFGSSVDNIYDAEDVDVLVVKGFNNKITERLERKLRIKLHVVKVSNLYEINDTLKKEIIKRHLLVEGVEKCVKWMLGK